MFVILTKFANILTKIMHNICIFIIFIDKRTTDVRYFIKFSRILTQQGLLSTFLEEAQISNVIYK